MEKGLRVAAEIFHEVGHELIATMQLKLFTIPIKNVSEAEAEMNGFLRGHRVLAVKKEFVPDGENSFWTFCVERFHNLREGSGGFANRGLLH